MSDAGTYTCIASNRAGETQRQFRLNVLCTQRENVLCLAHEQIQAHASILVENLVSNPIRSATPPPPLRHTATTTSDRLLPVVYDDSLDRTKTTHQLVVTKHDHLQPLRTPNHDTPPEYPRQYGGHALRHPWNPVDDAYPAWSRRRRFHAGDMPVALRHTAINPLHRYAFRIG
jgi:hypothetical protein